jgi:hypothetical protein
VNAQQEISSGNSHLRTAEAHGSAIRPKKTSSNHAYCDEPPLGPSSIPHVSRPSAGSASRREVMGVPSAHQPISSAATKSLARHASLGGRDMLTTDQSSFALSATTEGTGLRQQNLASVSAVADAGKPKAVKPLPSWLVVTATSTGTNAEHRRKSSALPVASSAFPMASLGSSSVAAHLASDAPEGRHTSLAAQKQPSPRPIAPVDLSSVAGSSSSPARNADVSAPGPVAPPADMMPRSKSPSPRSNGPVANTA